MGHTVVQLEELELFTGGEIITLPAALDVVLSTALSYLAIRWSTVASAGLFAAHLHHCAEQIIALIIVFEFLEERHFCQHIRHLTEPVVPQFLSQVSC